MGPKKDNDSSKVKRKLTKITIEVKKEVIAKHENGVRVSDLATQFGMAKSTISTILKNKETIKAADVAKGVTVLTKQRSQTIEEVEKMLLIWMNEKLLAGVGVSEGIICEQAKQLHDDLLKNDPSTSADTNVFKASKGWFENFKRRSGIQSVVKQKAIVEEKSSDEEEEREYVPSSLISEICAKWGEVQGFVERYHPNKAVAGRCINIFNDNAMSHFRNILKRKQKQILSDKVLVRQKPSESEAESSGAKRQKREREETPERPLPNFFMERDSPSKQ